MSDGKIEVRHFGGVTLELRHNPHGRSASLPPHSHADYQLILVQHMTIHCCYRGRNIVAPAGGLIVVHPGEVHSARGGADSQPSAPLRTMFIRPGKFQVFAHGQRRTAPDLPFFGDTVVQDPLTFSVVGHAYRVLEGSSSTLEKEAALLAALSLLQRRCSTETRLPRLPGRERNAVRCVREYLEDHYAENVSLDQLSEVAGLSPFYLCRVFHREVGLPPQAYQTQVRVERAKAQLLQGRAAGTVAAATGFADQSHLTRQFRRLVGVTPGRYRHLTGSPTRQSARSFQNAILSKTMNL